MRADKLGMCTYLMIFSGCYPQYYNNHQYHHNSYHNHHDSDHNHHNYNFNHHNHHNYDHDHYSVSTGPWILYDGE